jgi:hypothetical protein
MITPPALMGQPVLRSFFLTAEAQSSQRKKRKDSHRGTENTESSFQKKGIGR